MLRLLIRWSLTEYNGTIINAQLLIAMEKFNFFKNFKTLLMGEGPRRKTEKFCQIEKKIGDLYELDNFKQEIFFEKKIEIANVIFRTISTESEKFFLINRANRTRFSETRSLSDQNCMLKNV